MLRDSSKEKPVKAHVHSTPTFNYFNARLANIRDLDDYLHRANQYINVTYPDAIAGQYQDKYALKELMDAANIPPTDQYFLRLKTRRNYFSMIALDMDAFSNNAEEYVQKNPQIALKLYKIHEPETHQNNMFSLFSRHPFASSALMFGAIVAAGSLFAAPKNK